MKYKPEDFKVVVPDADTKRLVIFLDTDQHEGLKTNAKHLGTSMNDLVKRCLMDAGLFHVTEEETEPLLDLGR